MQMNFHRKLPIPQDVKKEYPLTERMEQVKAARDESIRAVFEGNSDKFILVIGPCSADHREPVLEYISRLQSGVPFGSRAVELDPLDADVLLGQRGRQQGNSLSQKPVQPLAGIVGGDGEFFHR